MAALKRLQKELSDLSRDPLANVSVSQSEAPFEWTATISGATATPYAGGRFLVKIRFPPSYPFDPPRVQFETKIFHPNINSLGQLSFDILSSSGWTPAHTVATVLLAICSLLEDPNPHDALVPEIAQLYRTNRPEFDETARDWTKRFA